LTAASDELDNNVSPTPLVYGGDDYLRGRAVQPMTHAEEPASPPVRFQASDPRSAIRGPAFGRAALVMTSFITMIAPIPDFKVALDFSLSTSGLSFPVSTAKIFLQFAHDSRPTTPRLLD